MCLVCRHDTALMQLLLPSHQCSKLLRAVIAVAQPLNVRWLPSSKCSDVSSKPSICASLLCGARYSTRSRLVTSAAASTPRVCSSANGSAKSCANYEQQVTRSKIVASSRERSRWQRLPKEYEIKPGRHVGDQLAHVSDPESTAA